MSATYDPQKFADAIGRLYGSAKSLTDDDLNQLATIRPQLAARARAKRAGAGDDIDLKYEKKTLSARSFLRFFGDFLAPMFFSHQFQITDGRDEARQRDAAQEFAIANLQARVASLAARVAELEAELKSLRQPV